MPHVALLPHLLKAYTVHYIGTAGIERTLMSAYPAVIFHVIAPPKLMRSFSLKGIVKNAGIPFAYMRAARACRRLISDIRPALVFSKGGFVALPVVRAAARCGVPCLLHESDRSLGLANRLCAKKVSKILTAFDLSGQGLPVPTVQTGIPLRPQLFTGTRQKGLASAGLTGDKPVLLCTGGSQGAAALNAALRKALPRLLPRFDVIHLTGKGNADAACRYDGYAQLEFTAAPFDLFAAADAVLTRAGATALFEFAALKKPMLIVPLPKGGSRGDQEENAAYFVARKLARVLPQAQLTPERLANELTLTYEARAALAACLTDACADGSAAVLKEIRDVRKRD
jgi:UDP-N-acetylglucosamine--N-acetylmuramyl-(pentapeptide) pyrophosphoryl-undecaprenol N-acetylglucosamine transferase